MIIVAIIKEKRDKMDIFEIIISIALPIYPILAIIILLKFNKLESQVLYFKSICEEATHISMIAEEQAIKTTRALNQHIEESKNKTKKAFFKGVDYANRRPKV